MAKKKNDDRERDPEENENNKQQGEQNQELQEQEGVIEEAQEMGPIKPKRVKTGRGRGFLSGDTNTEERYLPVRQARAEFGAVARITSAFKLTLDTHLRYISDARIYYHILSLFMRVLACDRVSPKGSATVAEGLKTQEGRDMFRDFCFNHTRTIMYALESSYKFDPTTGILHIKDLCGNQSVRYLKGKVHVGIQLILIRLDLTKARYAKSMSRIHYVRQAPTDIYHDVDLQAPIPAGDGPLMALIYIGQTDTFREEITWSYSINNNVLGVAGVGWE